MNVKEAETRARELNNCSRREASQTAFFWVKTVTDGAEAWGTESTGVGCVRGATLTVV